MLYCVCNSPRRNRKYFKTVYGSPASKSEVLFIGDAISDYYASVENGVQFICRDTDNGLFEKIECLKIIDLTNLQNIITNR